MSELTLDTVVARGSQALSAPVDDEIVMLDMASSTYFGLDRTGRRIWELLDEPRSVADVCTVLEREFDVEPERCHADVLAFLAALEEAKLVEAR
jgi:hypothetical protein